MNNYMSLLKTLLCIHTESHKSRACSAGNERHGPYPVYCGMCFIFNWSNEIDVAESKAVSVGGALCFEALLDRTKLILTQVY